MLHKVITFRIKIYGFSSLLIAKGSNFLFFNGVEALSYPYQRIHHCLTVMCMSCFMVVSSEIFLIIIDDTFMSLQVC